MSRQAPASPAGSVAMRLRSSCVGSSAIQQPASSPDQMASPEAEFTQLVRRPSPHAAPQVEDVPAVEPAVARLHRRRAAPQVDDAPDVQPAPPMLVIALPKWKTWLKSTQHHALYAPMLPSHPLQQQRQHPVPEKTVGGHRLLCHSDVHTSMTLQKHILVSFVAAKR